ncbi:MAG: aldo/keto reductase [Nanoarchaeota archaeon]|nr:aldo/keto reductase [Nanoarchaeota archaeon]
MSLIGINTEGLKGRKCKDIVKKSLEIGYRYIDVAEVGNNLDEIGSALEKFDRNEIFISYKIWYGSLSYKEVLKSFEKSLNKLKTSYIDLLLIHWPNKSIPLEQTLKAIKKIMDDGKIKFFGVSNFNINHLEKILKIADKIDLNISANQVEMHPFLYQAELLHFCKKNRIRILSYSPFGGGVILNTSVIKAISKRYGKTPAQIILRWLIEKETFIVTRSTSSEHLKENLQVFDFSLSDEEINKIDALGNNMRLINPPFAEFD